MQMTPGLRARIEERLSGISQRDLATSSEAVSRSYLRQDNRKDFQIRSESEAQAYLAVRLPATWAAAREVLARLCEYAPDFTPQTMLDLGAGPGTCTLAAQDMWPDISPTLIEKNPYLQEEGRYLCPRGEWITQDLSGWRGGSKCDLVIAGYVLNEFENIDKLIDKMWSATKGALVIIEPGTPHGYDVIIRARDRLIAAGAHIAAPCPHAQTCPLLGHENRWCHFSVRVERSKLHRAVKGGELGYEDEKFSYLIATREKYPWPAARIIGHPRGSKVIEAELCQADSTYNDVRISKRDDVYKALRRAKWGDSL